MPVLVSDFRPPFIYRSAHIQTTFPTLFRQVEGVDYQRERITTPDRDFIDLDWSYAMAVRGVKTLAVICHGLEGCAERAYMRGMAKACNRRGIDAVAYNYRGCSGEMNREKRFYNAGATDDLALVLDHIRVSCDYDSMYLIGFSLGANLVLKYVGEAGNDLPADIAGAAAISAPCDLSSSSVELHRMKNRLYHHRFLKMLLDKIRQKATIYPELLDVDLASVRTLKDFDDYFTGPVSGFRDAADYWQSCSCRQFLPAVRIPVLILNAADDPILGPECFPYQEARANDKVYLEVSRWGGHVGFMDRPGQDEYWHEKRTLEFIIDNAR
ncbi:MAG: alpha/beta fold hydrolase [Syntrophomonadaceae bacterium]|nr:alpha/beta fold hydrolase [Syntrophomonadaceae bacterium]